MQNNKILKFENPVRLAELSPKETLMKLGFKEGMLLCDVGAGTGIFSFAAAELTTKTIYALDLSNEMLEIISERCIERGINTIVPLNVASGTFPVPSGICDMACLVTVFHEVANKPALLMEIKRVLRPDGKLMMIEFHKKSTPTGPPVGSRLDEPDVISFCDLAGFELSSRFDLGENFYCLVFNSLK